MRRCDILVPLILVPLVLVPVMFAAGFSSAAAQPFPVAGTLVQQLRGRDLFNQSCMVCHVKLQITSPAKYGPDLSKNALGGQDVVMWSRAWSRSWSRA
jgi:mono/diheme cytochrome c family protein